MSEETKKRRDSSDESDIDESSDPLRPFEILSIQSWPTQLLPALSFVCFLRSGTLAFVSFLVFPILPDQLQEKLSYRKIISLPSAPFARKFHQEVNGGKLSLHWLAQLSENPVEGVCGRSLFAKQKIFLSAVFSNSWFSHDVTKIRTTKLMIFLRFYLNDV